MNLRCVNVINVLMYQGVKREHVQITWSTPWNVHDLFYVNGKFIYRTLLILFNPFVLHSQITPTLYYFMSNYNKSRLVLVLFLCVFGKFRYIMFLLQYNYITHAQEETFLNKVHTSISIYSFLFIIHKYIVKS